MLLVNVFFPPQTIGGATRVVRDNLDAFLAAPDSGIGYAVVASDHGVEVPYRLRVETYGVVPVFRISTPQQVNMDWRPLDDDVGDRFADVLQMWRPDLVHFHCVQRLTASVLEACADAGVPYLVTLHDAWWISDHQFLVDDKGRLQQPCESVPSAPPAPATVGDSLFRRRALSRLLNGAEAILAVSHTFAELYRGCGFQQVTAVPNGVSPMPSVMRKPSPSGRVRLAHVGGLAAHKGYDLLQAALKASSLSNLELTAVDHARFGGAEQRELWGATPVRFVGKTSQEQMHLFYAEQDVLLAPSIWPESFGLVAREALAAGLWVVASDRGAMAEDIVEGVNGLIVDVSDPAGLLAALSAIDNDPQRFLTPPAPTPLRTADAQAEDLLTIYRSLLARPRQAAPRPFRRGAELKPGSGRSARSARGRARDRS